MRSRRCRTSLDLTGDEGSERSQRTARRAAVRARRRRGYANRFGSGAVLPGDARRPQWGQCGGLGKKVRGGPSVDDWRADAGGLVGCGHIGMVHAVRAASNSRTPDLVDARLSGTYDDVKGKAANMARHHGGEPFDTLEGLLDDVDVVWVCTWTAAHLLAGGSGRRTRPSDLLRESHWRPTSRRRRGVAAALERVPHQVGLVLRWAPVFREIADRVASGQTRTGARHDHARRPVLPGQGLYGSTWRGDVGHAVRRAPSSSISIHDIDVLRWTLGDPVEVVGSYPRRASAIRGSRTRRRWNVSRMPARFGRPADERLASGAHPGVESPARGGSAEKALLWTDDDYLGPLHVQTDDGEEIVTASPPEWSAPVHPARGLRKGPWAQYAEPTKAFLDGLARRKRVEYPGRGRSAGWPVTRVPMTRLPHTGWSTSSTTLRPQTVGRRKPVGENRRQFVPRSGAV